MDLKYYEELLNRIAANLYGTKIVFDKKGVFEWDKRPDGSISERSIKVLHKFQIPTTKNEIVETKSKVSYLSLKNNIYISQISDESTVDVYSSGGGMVKRYTFKITDSKIHKVKETVISIR